MLGQPTLLTGHPRSQAQRQTLLAEEGIATIAGADAPYQALFGKMKDKATVRAEVAHGVEPRREIAGVAQLLKGDGAHAGHDAHADSHVGAVGDFHSHFAVRRGGRTHQVGQHVHGATLHCPAKQPANLLLRVGGQHPVVRRPGVVLPCAANEGQVLRPRHVAGVAAIQEAVRMRVGFEAKKAAITNHALAERLAFGVGPIAPDDLRWLSEGRGAIHPLFKRRR